MINIEYQFVDGANWQAQCVAIYLRQYRLEVIGKTYNKERREYEANIKIGRCENCREQGYIFTLEYYTINHYKQIVHFWVYEHRNSDCISVVQFDGNFTNTPTIDKVPMKDKYDTTKDFGWSEIIKCGDWIIDRMKEKLDEYLESIEQENIKEEV